MEKSKSEKELKSLRHFKECHLGLYVTDAYVKGSWKIEDGKSNEKMLIDKIDKMCTESLPPKLFENWEEIKIQLVKVRKNANN